MMTSNTTPENYDPWRHLLAAITWRTVRDLRNSRTPEYYRRSAELLLESKYYIVLVKDICELDVVKLLAR
jgi:hypothetical protein